MGKKNKIQQSKQPHQGQNSTPKPKISKPVSDKKNKKARGGEAATKMSNLFKIIPEHDDFAALGYED